MTSYVAPALPPQAREDVRLHLASGKVAVYRILPRQVGAECANCQGAGKVFVSFLGKGPWRSAFAGKSSTYLLADEMGRAGWYEILRTIAYVCPRCQGGMQPRGPAVASRPEIERSVDELTTQLAIPAAPRGDQ